MAVDIAPEILNDIMDHFEGAWHDNEKLPGLMDKLKSGTATYAEANEYAAEVGRMMKEAYATNLSSDRLPDGKCYYNIADKIIRDTEHMQYTRVTDYTMQVQQNLNKKAGIGLKAIAPEEDKGLVQSLINKAANADQYDDVAAYVSQTMESMSKKVVDHSIKANADFQYKAGMCPKIIRSGGSGCCEWCSGLSGKYNYPDVPSEVYARHNNCTCTVEYVPGDGKRQDVWSKNWISEEEAQRREELKTLGLDNSDKYAKIEYRKNIKSEAEINAEKRNNLENRIQNDIIDLKEGVTGYADDNFDRKLVPFSADQDLLATNPFYIRGEGSGYTDNCQRCVPTYLLRRQGYDVISNPSDFGHDRAIEFELRNAGHLKYVDKNGEHPKPIFTNKSTTFGKQEIEDYMKTLPEGAICEVKCSWKNGGSHVFVAEKRDDGIHYKDPQSGDPDVSRYFKKMKKGTTSYYRIDDTKVDEKYIWYIARNKRK